jgi:hypothetical protein
MALVSDSISSAIDFAESMPQVPLLRGGAEGAEGSVLILHR